VLQGDGAVPVPHEPERPTLLAVAGGRASGRLIGGCLNDFIYTVGLPGSRICTGRSRRELKCLLNVQGLGHDRDVVCATFGSAHSRKQLDQATFASTRWSDWDAQSTRLMF